MEPKQTPRSQAKGRITPSDQKEALELMRALAANPDFREMLRAFRSGSHTPKVASPTATEYSIIQRELLNYCLQKGTRAHLSNETPYHSVANGGLRIQIFLAAPTQDDFADGLFFNFHLSIDRSTNEKLSLAGIQLRFTEIATSEHQYATGDQHGLTARLKLDVLYEISEVSRVG